MSATGVQILFSSFLIRSNVFLWGFVGVLQQYAVISDALDPNTNSDQNTCTASLEKENRNLREALEKASREVRALRQAFSKKLEHQLESRRLDREWPEECERVSVDSITQSSFYSKIILQAKPVAISNGIRAMGAMSKWMDMKYLEEAYGNTKHSFRRGIYKNNIEPRVEFAKDGIRLAVPSAEEVTLNDFFEIVRSSHRIAGDLNMYSTKSVIVEGSEYMKSMETSNAMNRSRDMPSHLRWQMTDDIELPEFASFMNSSIHSVNLWLGTHGVYPKQSQLHFDPLDNLVVMLSGEKEFVMFDGLAHSHTVYPMSMHGSRNSRPVRQTEEERQGSEHISDHVSPVVMDDDVGRFPRFEKSLAMKCRLQPGDALYYPAFIWHHVYSWKNKTDGINAAVNMWFHPAADVEGYHSLVHDVLVAGNTAGFAHA